MKCVLDCMGPECLAFAKGAARARHLQPKDGTGGFFLGILWNSFELCQLLHLPFFSTSNLVFSLITFARAPSSTSARSCGRPLW